MEIIELVNKNLNELLKDKVENIELPTSNFVIRQGEKPIFCYILLEGKVKVFHNTPTDQNFLFGIYEEPQIFGHLEMPNKENFFNSVQCLTPCKFLKFTRELYLEWLRNDSDFAMRINFDLCTKLMKASYRMVDESSFPLEYHVIKYIIEASENFKKSTITLNKKDLAGYFGTNLRSINRILKQLNDKQMILVSKEKLIINQPNELNTCIKKYF